MMYRRLLLVALILGVAGWGSRCFSQDVSSSSVILGRPGDYSFQSGVSYVPESVFAGHGKSALFELDGDWPFGLINDVGNCDIDMGLLFQDVIFLDNAGLGLPSQVGKLAFDAGFTFRPDGANAYQLRLQPGFYTDFESFDTDGLFVPFSGSIIHSFTPDFTGIIGVQIRPNFETVVMPVAGVAWQVGKSFRIDAGIPRSRIEWTIVPDIKTYIALDWRNTSYYLDESQNHGDLFTVEDFRAYWGMQFRVASTLQLCAEVGEDFNRSVEFDENPRAVVDIEDSFFVRVAVGIPY